MYIDSFSNNKTLTLKRAIMVYDGADGSVIASHTVDNGKIGSGSFLGEKDVRELARALSKSHKSKPIKAQLHGDDVLGCGDEFLCFAIDVHKRVLFFGKHLPDVLDVEVPLPRLIVIQKHSKTFLVACKSKGRRPNAGTPLFHAPLPEIDPDGKIHSCGIRYKAGVRFQPTMTREIGDTILSARFNSIRTQKLCKGDYSRVIKGAVEAGQFPNSQLQPFGMTLGAFIDSL